MKIDLKKAYDPVSWEFMREVLVKMGFPTKFIRWVMECISCPKFSILINGSLKRFFQGTRGLRQGDPISSYLFCLAIEIFSSILEKEISTGNISLIPKCKCLRLSHLIFADDLMNFPKANARSLETINRLLELFLNILGLCVNRDKPTLLFAGIPEEIEQ